MFSERLRRRPILPSPSARTSDYVPKRSSFALWETGKLAGFEERDPGHRSTGRPLTPAYWTRSTISPCLSRAPSVRRCHGIERRSATRGLPGAVIPAVPVQWPPASRCRGSWIRVRSFPRGAGFCGLPCSAQIHHPPAFCPLPGPEMGNKRIDVVSMLSCDAVLDLPQFFDEFVRHPRSLL